MWTDDPIADYENYCVYQEKNLKMFPKCVMCGEYITDDSYFDMMGEILCEDCLNHECKKDVDAYVIANADFERP